ncbi:MAG: hypothetical protein B7Y95_18515, partial [Rhizobiales bacterium 32-66-11]
RLDLASKTGGLGGTGLLGAAGLVLLLGLGLTRKTRGLGTRGLTLGLQTGFFLRPEHLFGLALLLETAGLGLGGGAAQHVGLVGRLLLGSLAARLLRCRGALPLLLQAYPFTSPPDQPASSMFVDDAVADEPDNNGATILAPNGTPSKASAQRMYAAAYFRSAYEITREMSAHLDAAGLLEPWVMGLPEDPPLGPFPAFLILRPSAFASDAFRPFVQTFGLAGMRLVNAHALSLYRASVLYQNARRALAPRQLAGLASA